MEEGFFDKLYNSIVEDVKADLIEAWNEHGSEWLDHLSGGHYQGDGLRMDQHRSFLELSRLEQIAFAQWWFTDGKDNTLLKLPGTFGGNIVVKTKALVSFSKRWAK